LTKLASTLSVTISTISDTLPSRIEAAGRDAGCLREARVRLVAQTAGRPSRPAFSLSLNLLPHALIPVSQCGNSSMLSRRLPERRLAQGPAADSAVE
jgi:hypothetical protein